MQIVPLNADQVVRVPEAVKRVRDSLSFAEVQDLPSVLGMGARLAPGAWLQWVGALEGVLLRDWVGPHTFSTAWMTEKFEWGWAISLRAVGATVVATAAPGWWEDDRYLYRFDAGATGMLSPQRWVRTDPQALQTGVLPLAVQARAPAPTWRQALRQASVLRWRVPLQWVAPGEWALTAQDYRDWLTFIWQAYAGGRPIRWFWEGVAGAFFGMEWWLVMADRWTAATWADWARWQGL